MIGPEHYREAEQLLGVDWGSELAPVALAAAQVHATLALAAAQVEAVVARGPGDCRAEWVEAVS